MFSSETFLSIFLDTFIKDKARRKWNPWGDIQKKFLVRMGIV